MASSDSYFTSTCSAASDHPRICRSWADRCRTVRPPGPCNRRSTGRSRSSLVDTGWGLASPYTRASRRGRSRTSPLRRSCCTRAFEEVEVEATARSPTKPNRAPERRRHDEDRRSSEPLFLAVGRTTMARPPTRACRWFLRGEVTRVLDRRSPGRIRGHERPPSLACEWAAVVVGCSATPGRRGEVWPRSDRAELEDVPSPLAPGADSAAKISMITPVAQADNQRRPVPRVRGRRGFGSTAGGCVAPDGFRDQTPGEIRMVASIPGSSTSRRVWTPPCSLGPRSARDCQSARR